MKINQASVPGNFPPGGRKEYPPAIKNPRHPGELHTGHAEGRLPGAVAKGGMPNLESMLSEDSHIFQHCPE